MGWRWGPWQFQESTYSKIPKHRKAGLTDTAKRRQKMPYRTEQWPQQMSDALMFSLVGTATGRKPRGFLKEKKKTSPAYEPQFIGEYEQL